MRAVTVYPSGALRGEAAIPGDKSITHRAFLLAALADGPVRVRGANPGEDCARSLRAVEAMGVEVARDADAIVLRGAGGRLVEPERELDCGNSGTTLRILAGILAGQPFFASLTGDDSLRRRPVGRIVEPLRRMGATLMARDQDRYPPLSIRGGRLRAIVHESPVASAQVKSCVLLAGLAADGTTAVVEPARSRDHTERMLGALGVRVETASAGRATRTSVAGPARLSGGAIDVPGDYSAAAFLLVAAALRPGSEIVMRGVGVNPGRVGLGAVLARMGVRTAVPAGASGAGEPVADLRVTGVELRGTGITADEVPAMVDELPIWAVAAAFAHGVSRVEGAAELRVKETDRLRVVARNLTALGGRVTERPDGLEIEGGGLEGGTVDSDGDHRIAMAFAVAALGARGPITVRGIENVATSFPGFFDTLRALGARCELSQVEDLSAEGEHGIRRHD